MKVGNYNLEMKEKEGYTLIAPLSYWHSTEEEVLAHTGGCGPGKLGDVFVPDTMWGESVFLACQIHDWMYHVGRDKQDKRIADLCFLVNMVSIVDDGEALDLLRLRRCMTYYSAVAHSNAYFQGKET